MSPALISVLSAAAQPARAAAHQHEHLDALRHGFELADGLPDGRRLLRHARFGRIAFEREGGVDRGAALRSRGNSRQAKLRNTTPAIASPMPTGVKSNMPNGSPMSSPRSRDTMMFGEVPTSVTMPPSSEPNAIGIS